MIEPVSWQPVLAVAVSFVAAALILVTRSRPGLAMLWTLVAAVVKLGLVVSLLPPVLAGGTVASPAWPLFPGHALQLRVDALGLLFALVASTLWLLTSIYSWGYISVEEERGRPRYFASFAVCLAATIGLAFAANLPTFFVFYEMLTLATYPLVVHYRSAEALAAGRKYLLYTLSGGQLLLVAVVWTSWILPGEGFRGGGFLQGNVSDLTAIVLFALFIVGCGVKAAVMPLHGWLPAAMVAPTPVSALLHAVAVVKAGVFGCLRVVGFVFGVDLMRELGLDVVLAAAAGVTIILASLRAFGEDHLKRRLAYSTIGQLSYILLGAALGSFLALLGAFFHIAAHAFMKITLFFCAGAIHRTSGRGFVSLLGGLGRRMPVTFVAFGIGALGLAGMPLLVGFVSKWSLGLGALAAERPMFVPLLVLSGVLNLAYLIPIVRTGFFDEYVPTDGLEKQDPRMWIPLSVTAAATLALGIYPDAWLDLHRLATLAAEDVVLAPLRWTAGP